jgi:hypothetical protein
MPQANLTPQSIKQAIEDISGYPYELEIVRRVEAYKRYYYWVEPNYSFEDHDTGEARELDLHATGAASISLHRSEFAFIVALASCKANKNPYVFFTRELPFSGITLNSDVPIAGCPLEIYGEDDESEAIEWYFQLHHFLHIAKMNIVSSQFCELVWKNNKWGVQSEAIFKNTFIPLIKAMSREIDEHNKASVPKKEELSTDYQLYYPFLVLRGPMFEYHMPPSGPAQLRDTKHILFIRHYTSRTVKCCYAIDIIHESYLEQYLDLIGQELNKFTNLVRRHRKPIVRSIQKLAELQEKRKQAEGKEDGG